MEHLSWSARRAIRREMMRSGRRIGGIIEQDLNRPRLVPAAAKNLLEGIVVVAGVGLASYFFLSQDGRSPEAPVRPEHEVRDQMPETRPEKPQHLERQLLPLPPEEQPPKAVITGVKAIKPKKNR